MKRQNYIKWFICFCFLFLLGFTPPNIGQGHNTEQMVEELQKCLSPSLVSNEIVQVMLQNRKKKNKTPSLQVSQKCDFLMKK